MEKKFRTAVFLMSLPIAVNVAVTIFCLMAKGPAEFKGYLLGTVLGIIFSFAWVIMVKKITFGNIMKLFALSLGSLPVKMIFFALFAWGGLYLLQMDRMFFSIAFLLGMATSLVIEVWFIISVNKYLIKQKQTNQNSE